MVSHTFLCAVISSFNATFSAGISTSIVAHSHLVQLEVVCMSFPGRLSVPTSVHTTKCQKPMWCTTFIIRNYVFFTRRMHAHFRGRSKAQYYIFSGTHEHHSPWTNSDGCLNWCRPQLWKMSPTCEIMWYWWNFRSTDMSEHIAVFPLAIVRMQQWLLPTQAGQRQKVPKLSLLPWVLHVQACTTKATCFCAICLKAACLYAMCFDMICVRRECACTARTHTHTLTHTHTKVALQCTNSKKAHTTQ
jgi:hypothetical protein